MHNAAIPSIPACMRSGGSEASVFPGEESEISQLRNDTNVPNDAISRSTQIQMLTCSAAMSTIPLETNPLKSGTPEIESAAIQNARAVTGIFFWSPPMRLSRFSPVFHIITPTAMKRRVL